MRVMLATPSLDGVPSIEYQTSVLRTNALLASQGIQLDINFLRGDQFIAKARNGLIQGFLVAPEKPDCIFFVDDDEGWDEQGFLRMVLDPHEFVAAAVPKKTDTGEFNNVILDTLPDNQCVIENGMIRAKQIGSGFIRLKRSAIEKLIKAFPKQYAPGDGGPHPLHYALFDSRIIWPEKGNDPGQFWGEDLEFCKKWAALGEYIWIDPNVSMEHAGRKTWRSNFLDYLKSTCQVVMNEPKVTPLPQTATAIEQLAAADGIVMPGTTLPRGNVLTNTLFTDELTPTQVAANTTGAQSFTVVGLAVGDFVVGASQDAQTAGIFIANCRVTAANTLEVLFGNATGSGATPVAGTYNFLVLRSEYNPLPSDAS